MLRGGCVPGRLNEAITCTRDELASLHSFLRQNCKGPAIKQIQSTAILLPRRQSGLATACPLRI